MSTINKLYIVMIPSIQSCATDAIIVSHDQQILLQTMKSIPKSENILHAQQGKICNHVMCHI